MMLILAAFWPAASRAFGGTGVVYALGFLHSGARGSRFVLGFSGTGAPAAGGCSGRSRSAGYWHRQRTHYFSTGPMLALGRTRSLAVAAVLIAVNGFGVAIPNLVSTTVRQADVSLEQALFSRQVVKV